MIPVFFSSARMILLECHESPAIVDEGGTPQVHQKHVSKTHCTVHITKQQETTGIVVPYHMHSSSTTTSVFGPLD